MEFEFHNAYRVQDGRVFRDDIDDSEKPILEKLVCFVEDAVKYYLNVVEISETSLIDYLRQKYSIKYGMGGRELLDVLVLRRDLFATIDFYAQDLRQRSAKRFFNIEDSCLFDILVVSILNENYNFQDDSFYTLFKDLEIDTISSESG